MNMENLDFWNIEKDAKDNVALDITNTKEFQVKFIVDLLNNADNIVSNESIETHTQPDQYKDNLNVIKSFNLLYQYENHQIPIDITIVTDSEKNDFDLKFSTITNSDIDFSWIDKNPALEKKVLNCLI